MLPQHFDIPAEFKAVFSNDGRVFYDLELIADMVEATGEQFDAETDDSEFFAGYNEAVRQLALSLRQSRDCLILEDTMKNS